MRRLATLFEDGENGSLSSKRLITFLAFILCSIAFISNLFFNKTVETYMFEGMVYITMAGLGVTVAEKFTSKTTNYQQGESTYTTRSKILGNKIPQQDNREL